MARDTGSRNDGQVGEAEGGLPEELAAAREVIDRRYDDLESGRVQLIDGEAAYRLLMARTAAQRRQVYPGPDAQAAQKRAVRPFEGRLSSLVLVRDQNSAYTSNVSFIPRRPRAANVPGEMVSPSFSPFRRSNRFALFV